MTVHVPTLGRVLAGALLLAGAAATPPAAARAQSVMGQVLDSATRRPLAGVPVRLRRAPAASTAGAPLAAAADTVPVAQGVTQPDGVFVLMAPDSGAYQVRIGENFAGPVFRLARDGDDQHLYLVPAGAPAAAGGDPSAPASDRVYGEREVTRRAAYMTGTGERVDMRAVIEARPPTGPRTRYVALVDVVVGVDGRAEAGSARLVTASEPTYGGMALRQVQTGRFTPAHVDGRPVRQQLRVPVEAEVRTEVRVERVGP